MDKLQILEAALKILIDDGLDGASGVLGALGELKALDEFGGELAPPRQRGHDLIDANGRRVQVKTFLYESRNGGNIKVSPEGFDVLVVYCYRDGEMVRVLEEGIEKLKAERSMYAGKLQVRAAALVD